MINFKENYLLISQSLDKQNIDCCTSSNIDDSIKKLVKKEFKKTDLWKKLLNYPEVDFLYVKSLLKKNFGVGKFLIGSGSEDLITKINTYSKLIKKKIVVLSPIFYRTYSNIKPIRTIKYEELFNIYFKENEICWINNPNPINGIYLNKSDLISIFKKFPKTIFAIDETTIFYLDDWKNKTLFSEVKNNKNIIVISSLSKYFGLPGLRFGFGLTQNNIFNKLINIFSTFPINSISNELAISVLKNINKFENIKKIINKNKKRIINKLNSNKDIEIIDSKFNFIWCKSKSNKDLYKKFLENGILVFKSSKKNIRITVHSSKEINKKIILKIIAINKNYEKK